MRFLLEFLSSHCEGLWRRDFDMVSPTAYTQEMIPSGLQYQAATEHDSFTEGTPVIWTSSKIVKC
jgi:hypothetical protein